MKRKVVSCLIIGAMLASLLAGCGSQTQETAETSATGTETLSTADETEETEAGTGFAGFDEMQEISLYSITMFDIPGLQEVEDAINAISEEKINVHVTLNQMDTPTYMEQIGLMLAGGESMDLLETTAIPVVSYATMTAQNELMDISPYLEEYAPEMTEMMSKYLNATTLNGGIYAVPNYRCMNSGYYLFMRKDITDYLGLTEQAEAVDSWSDYEAIMQAVYDAQDTLPEELQTTAMTANSDTKGAVLNFMYADLAPENFADCYGYETLGDSNKIVYVDPETDKVSCYFESEDYRTTVERVYKWAQEDLVYKDAATDTNGAEVACMNGVTFSWVSQAEAGAEASKEASTGYDLICTKILDIPLQTSNANGWCWAVATTSENPEAAVAFMNLMYTNEEIENLFVYGIEGRDYELNDQGEAVVTEDAQYQSSDFLYGNVFLAYPGEGSGSDFRETSLEEMENAELSKYYGCVVDTTEISNELTALANVITQYGSGIESGAVSPDEIDTMIDALESNGMQDVIDYYQSQLDAWLAEQ